MANRLSAMPRSQDAGSLSRAALSVATARVRSPVLLKTNLPRPGTSPRKRPAGRVGYQYIGAALCKQTSGVTVMGQFVRQLKNQLTTEDTEGRGGHFDGFLCATWCPLWLLGFGP